MEGHSPAPSSYPGAPRRRPSNDARATAFLSAAVALLSVVVMAVVGERSRFVSAVSGDSKGGEKTMEQERRWEERRCRENCPSLFLSFHPIERKTEKNPKGATLTELKSITKALDVLSALESALP